MEVVEYRRSSSSAGALGLCHSGSVRSSLRLFGARWRSGSVCAASKEHCDQETNQRSAVTVVGASTVPGHSTRPAPSTAPSQQQRKQKSLRIPWLPVFFHLQKNHLKSSSANVGKRKTRLLCSEVPDSEETVPGCHASKASLSLGPREERAQWPTCASLRFLAEQPDRQLKVSSPQLIAKESSSSQGACIPQKCMTLARSTSPVEPCRQEEPHFVPLVSIVGTERRNSMWALGASKPSMLRCIYSHIYSSFDTRDPAWWPCEMLAIGAHALALLTNSFCV
jgi:hypothetical protein